MSEFGLFDEMVKIRFEALREFAEVIDRLRADLSATAADWSDLTTAMGVFDEHIGLQFRAEFTPKLFNEIWSSMSKEHQINYIRSLFEKDPMI